MHFAIKQKKCLFEKGDLYELVSFLSEVESSCVKGIFGTECNPTCFNCHLFSAKRQYSVFKARSHTLLAAFTKSRGAHFIKMLTFIHSVVSLYLNWHESNECWEMERNTLI